MQAFSSGAQMFCSRKRHVDVGSKREEEMGRVKRSRGGGINEFPRQ